MRRFLALVLIAGCSSSSEATTGEDDASSAEETSAEAASDDTASGTDSETDSGTDSGTMSMDSMTTDSMTTDTGPSGSTGCSATAMAAGVTNESIDVAGTKRTYVLSIPAGYDGKKPWPLAFGWHGRTGNGALFRSYSGVETASAKKAIFVYADGLTVTPGVPADTGWELTATGRDLKLYDAMLDDLKKKLCVDDKKVWSFGHSYGGYMSNFLGCQRGGKTLHAIAPYAGGLAGTAGCGKVPAWIGHAEDDMTVNFSEGTKARDFWVKQSGCDATKTAATDPSPCVAYQGCGTDPVVWCDAKTGGHNWPAFAGSGIWTFFSKL
ncbi:MAG: alpha/beta hydrolase family esterase [Polyangiales bacterium]